MASKKSSKKEKRKSKKRQATPQDEVVAAFMGCPRCSFFLVGYRLLHDDFERAVEGSQDGWLTLSWDHAVNRLVYKSYGRQLEADAYHLQGSCQFCWRAFIFETAEADDTESADETEAEEQLSPLSTLRVAIKNR